MGLAHPHTLRPPIITTPPKNTFHLHTAHDKFKQIYVITQFLIPDVLTLYLAW